MYAPWFPRGLTSPFSIAGGSCSLISTGGHFLQTQFPKPSDYRGGGVTPTVSLHCFLFLLLETQMLQILEFATCDVKKQTFHVACFANKNSRDQNCALLIFIFQSAFSPRGSFMRMKENIDHLYRIYIHLRKQAEQNVSQLPMDKQNKDEMLSDKIKENDSAGNGLWISFPDLAVTQQDPKWPSK